MRIVLKKKHAFEDLALQNCYLLPFIDQEDFPKWNDVEDYNMRKHLQILNAMQL